MINSEGEIVANSTCGFRTDLADVFDMGPIVDYSGGFCCACPAMIVFTGVSDGVYRGDCGFLSSNETAHCLEFSETLFAGYTIGDHMWDYDITLDLSYKSKAASNNPAPSDDEAEKQEDDEMNNNDAEQQRMLEEQQNEENGELSEDDLLSKPETDYVTISEVLSINQRMIKNSILSASIIGDYMPVKPPPDLKDKIFLRPLPKEIPVDAVSHVQNDWLIVNPGMVTLDGSECDKIGNLFTPLIN